MGEERKWLLTFRINHCINVKIYVWFCNSALLLNSKAIRQAAVFKLIFSDIVTYNSIYQVLYFKSRYVKYSTGMVSSVFSYLITI